MTLPTVYWLTAGCVLGVSLLAQGESAFKKPQQQHSAQQRHGIVSQMSLSEFLPLYEKDSVLVYDVRPAFVYHFGHIQGAICWPKSAFEKQFSQHETELVAARKAKRRIVIYCADAECPDSRTVASKLAEKGYSASVLEGGWATWQQIQN